MRKSMLAVASHAGAFAPGRIVVHAVRRVGDHQVGVNASQEPLHILCRRAVATDEPMAAKHP